MTKKMRFNGKPLGGFRGLAAMALALCLLFAGCGDKDSDDSGGGLPAAKGKLTVNGLSKYDGKYIYCSGQAGSVMLLGCENVPSFGVIDLVKISDGRAAIPLYYVKDENASTIGDYFGAYEGNDAITNLWLAVFGEASITSEEINCLDSCIIGDGKFTDGNADVTWTK